MKTKLTLMITLIVLTFSSGFGMKVKSYSVNKKHLIMPLLQNPLSARIVRNDSGINLQVSFDENQGNQGRVKIINSLNQLVLEYDAQLVASPNYYNINLSEFSNGTYTIELNIQNNTYSTVVDIQ